MADEGSRSRGVVSKFIVSKGYGFIKQLDGDDGGDGAGELFFHQSVIKSKGLRMLKKGQVVEFFVVRKGDKIKAIDVTVVNEDRDDSGERNSSDGGGSNRRNWNSSGGGKCCDFRKIGCIVRDCDKCGGGSGVGGGSGGDKVGGGVLVAEAPVAKVAGKTDTRVGGGGGGGSSSGSGGDSRHLRRDGDKVGGGILVAEAPVAKVAGKTDTRVGGGSSSGSGSGGDSRHLGRDGDKVGGGVLVLEAPPVAKVVGKTDSRAGGVSRHLGRDGVLASKAPVVRKTGNRVGGGDSRRLASNSKNVGNTLAVKEVAAFAKVVPNISLHVGGGMRVRVDGGGSKMDTTHTRVGKLVGDTSSSVSGIDSGHLAKDYDTALETVFAKFGIHNNIGGKRDRMANDCEDLCYNCDKPGHTSSDCKGFCYNCEQYGHMASDCPGFCYNCLKPGHMASDCPGFCYNCDRHGHMASNCPGFCYNCDQHGHMASNCPGFCYNCLKPGHMASDCPGFRFS